MKKNNGIKLSTTQIILLSFLSAVLLGSLLLSLPISTKSGQSVPYIDALFTSTTATCVTGLVTLPTATVWSAFGQAVILVLIQIGGLGIITVMTGFMIMFHRRMGIGDRLLLQDAFNLNTLAGLAAFVRKVLLGTFIVEGVGALMYMLVFVPEFGVRGIWISIFNSVSAFCNAGIDVIGESSLIPYALNPLINTVTAVLIIIGGIGYIVWWDVIRVLKSRFKRDGQRNHFTLHTKIALVSTAVLVFGGALLILICEFNNPLTIGDMSLFDKIQVSLFQAVTTRTAGFMTVMQENLTNASSMISLVLMFIGGSPVGTAGGVKTVTVAVLVYSAFSVITNKSRTSLFNRTVSLESILKAAAVVMTSVVIMLTSTVLLAVVTDADMLDILYETVSATATVGLSRSLTPTLNIMGKIVIMITMYLGRVGPISLALALGRRKKVQDIVLDPVEDISIG